MAQATSRTHDTITIAMGANMIVDHSLTTSLNPANDDLGFYTPTPISLLFTKLLGSLAVSIEAERDIEGVSAGDPAIDHWLRDAERAWAAVSEIGAALCAAQVLRDQDRPLVKMAQIVNVLMAAQTLDEYLAARKRLHQMAGHLRYPQQGATARRVTQMLRQCRTHLATMIDMDAHQPAIDPDVQTDGMLEVWREAC
ncbi:hypothetical protein [Lentibacter sp. XHP0401]|uniref:hypothetical protein n=1 Tax=Lentibacter sp. XHP0401 TaxID=2984334 RepID=UPI0021E94007|nr:hypothetical protein [Lentibacter sp. XHP0401]MCV2894999.1 hypothetical protein [Lentibacter sp. XHP0401]